MLGLDKDRGLLSAEAFWLTIPQFMLLLADEVIE
jgi:hypothetical protein